MSKGYSKFNRLHHRLESPTQTPQDAVKQLSSGEIWGKAPRGSHIPQVKAYRGALPKNSRGTEFITFTPPDQFHVIKHTTWSGPRPGVIVEGDYAKIKVIIIKNTQT